MYRFYWLEKLEFDGEGLVVHLAELLRGEPDGLIGLPLDVQPESPRHRVSFSTTGAFKTLPEMFNEVSEDADRIAPFLFRELNSPYMTEMKDAMELSRGIPPDQMHHYVVYAENTVTHVLSAVAPKVFAGTQDGP